MVTAKVFDRTIEVSPYVVLYAIRYALLLPLNAPEDALTLVEGYWMHVQPWADTIMADAADVMRRNEPGTLEYDMAEKVMNFVKEQETEGRE